MNPHLDFNERTEPEPGTLRDVMHRLGLKDLDEARRAMGLPVREKVPLKKIRTGRLFRFNAIVWQKKRGRLAVAIHDKAGPLYHSAVIADHVLVEPLDEEA